MLACAPSGRLTLHGGLAIPRPKVSPMLRFSLSFLLLFVLVVALGCAALSYANEYWASAVLTVTLAALVLSVLAAVYRRGASRAFWAGFAIFGGCYLFLMYGPWFAELRMLLATTKLVAYAQSKLQAEAPVGTFDLERWYFEHIGHCLWALLLAGLGGLASRVLYATGTAKQHSEQGSHQ